MSDPLEVWTSHRDVGDVVKELAPFVDDTSLRLPAARRIPDGDWVRFSVHLLDGSKVLEGIGRCQGSTQEGASTYRVRLSLLSFDERNEIMWERMLLAREDGAHSTGNFDMRSLREKILKPPPSAPSKSVPPPPPPRAAGVRRPPSVRPPPPPKPSTRPPAAPLPAPAPLPRPSSFPPPRPSSFPPPRQPPSAAPRAGPAIPKLEARPRAAPPAPPVAPLKPLEPRGAPIAASRHKSAAPLVDPGLVDDGWSDRPPPLTVPDLGKVPPLPHRAPVSMEDEDGELTALQSLEPTPTQVAHGLGPRGGPAPDSTSAEIAAPPSAPRKPDAALAPTAERTSPATALPDGTEQEGSSLHRLTAETHAGLRLEVPARLVERARALAPNLPAGLLRVESVRETREEAVLRSALSIGLASLAALADADDDS